MVEWVPIAFDLLMDIPDADLSEMPSGSATFVDGVLNWTSTYSSWTYASAYVDPFCGYSGYGGYGSGYYDGEGAEPAKGKGSHPEYYGGDISGPATGFTGGSNLPCVAETYEDYPDGIDIDDDWGEETTPGEDDEDVPTVPPEEPDGSEFYASDLVDIWSINLNAGDEVVVTVDTLDALTMFDAYMLITGPDYCPVAYADDDFSCTEDYFEGYGACPGVEFIADDDGVYHIIISALECAAEEATYQVGIDAATDPGLSLVADNVEPYTMVSTAHTVTGTAIITD